VLTETEKSEILEELRKYAHKQAACTEALKIIQKYRGWVTDEGIQDVAQFLKMTPDEVENLATFYNLIFRRPVGKHVILICDSVSCWVMGYDFMREYLTSRLGINLGETTPDGKFTLLPVACLGACDRAPVMMIDNEFYADLDEEKIDEILSKYSRGNID